jgi:hypothetical protein
MLWSISAVALYLVEFIDIHSQKHKHRINMKAVCAGNLKQSALDKQ